MEGNLDEATTMSIPDHDINIPLQGEFDMRKNNDENVMVGPQRKAMDLDREMEKRKIREEIMASEYEVDRRRELEAEVRRELMMEKQMMGTKDDQFGEDMVSHPLESNVIGSVEKEQVHGVTSLGKRPFGRDPSYVGVQFAGKSGAELAEDEVMAQVIPSSGITGVKRKAERPARACDGETAPTLSQVSEKKWFCSLCEVSTTSEVTLNGHLQGKKHKAKEVMAKSDGGASNVSVNSDAANSPTQSVEPGSIMTTDPDRSSVSRKWECSLCQLSVNSEILLRSHLLGKKHKAKEAKLLTSQKIKISEQNTTEIDRVSDLSSSDASDPTKKWYCSLCEVSASSENNLNDHLQGKKHKAKAGISDPEKANMEVDPVGWVSEAVNITKEKNDDVEEVPEDEQGCSSRSAKADKHDEIELDLTNKSSKAIASDEATPDADDLKCSQTEENMIVTEDMEQLMKQGSGSTEFVKYWHCKMCNKGTHDEATMAFHRKSAEHKALLRKNGGGLISVSNIPTKAPDAGGKFEVEPSSQTVS